MIYLTFVVFQIHQVDALKPKHISHQHKRKYTHHHHHHNHGTNLHYSSLNNIERGGGTVQKTPPSLSSPRASKKLLQSMRLLYLTYYASLGALMRK